MPVDPNKLAKAIENILSSDSATKKGSLAKMFTKAALIDLKLAEINDEGTVSWVGNDEVKSYKEFLSLDVNRQKSFAGEYINVARGHLTNELAKRNIKDVNENEIDEKLLESLFIKGARATAETFRRDKLKAIASDAAVDINPLIASITIENPVKLENINIRHFPAPDTRLELKLPEKIELPESPIKTHDLKAVNVRAERFIPQGTDKTPDELRREAMPSYNEWLTNHPEATAKQQLDEVKRLYKDMGVKGGMVFRIDDTDKVLIYGDVIKEHLASGLYPATRLKGITAKIEDKFSDEIYLSSNTGTLSDEQQLYLGLVSRFKGQVPISESPNAKGQAEGRFINDKDSGNISIVFKAKPELVEEVMDYLPKERRDALKGKTISLEYAPNFKIDDYEKFLKDKSELLDKGLTYNFFDRTPNITNHQQLFGDLKESGKPQFAMSKYGRDFDTVNTLITQFPDVNVADYKERYYHALAFERESYSVWKKNSTVTSNPEASSEDKAQSNSQLADIKKLINENVQSYEDTLKAVSDIDIRNSNGQIKNAVKILKLTAKNDLLLAELDNDIVNSEDAGQIKKAAAKYDGKKNRNDVKLFELNSSESMPAMSELLKSPEIDRETRAELKYLIDSHEKEFSTKPWIKENNIERDDSDKLKYVSKNNLIPNPLPFSGSKIGKPYRLELETKSLDYAPQDNAQNGLITNLNISGSNNIYLIKNDIRLEIDGKITASFLSDKNNSNQKLFLPLEQNPQDYNSRQKLNADLIIRANSFNETGLHAEVASSVASKITRGSIDHKFIGIDSGYKTLGITLPGKQIYNGSQLGTGFGVKASAGGKLLLTGDELNYDIGINIAQADFKKVNSLAEIKSDLITSTANLNYINGSVNARLNAEYNSFANFSERNNNFSNLGLNASVANQWKGFSLELSAAGFTSSEFKMFDMTTKGEFGNGKLNHSLSTGLTSLKLDLPGQHEVGEIVKLGYSLGVKSENILNKAKVEIDFSQPLNKSPFPYNNIGIKISKQF